MDSNGLLPLRAAGQVFGRAFDFRRYLQKALPTHLNDFPKADGLGSAQGVGKAEPAKEIFARWPKASGALLEDQPGSLSNFAIDHSVAPAALRGGHENARRQILHFLDKKLGVYAEQRNQPELNIASGMSPYLHFGHISTHEIFAEVARIEKWRPEKLALRGNGSREGWWNMGAASEGYLDELITWREVGYNFSSKREDYNRYESLPEWAQKTLGAHAKDERQHRYTLEQLEAGETYDALWNAAQLQMVREGHIHNYLRMLWGKKILEWTKSPQEAAKVMIQLNNKYGLDGRNPNSYSGIFWCLGRYDRPWGPERAVFGLIRYMSSENTARKVRVKGYIEKYGQGAQGTLGL